MAHIYLKIMKEPMYVNLEVALKVKGIFEDDSIPNSQIVRLKGWSGFKSDIRSVFIENEIINPQLPLEPEKTPEEKIHFTQLWKELREHMKTLNLKADR